jgi:hypothetical protein
MCVQLEIERGQSIERASQGGGQPRGEQRVGRGHAQARPPLHRARLQHLAQAGEQRSSVFEQPLAFRGQAHAAAVALDELTAHLALERCDALADRRLRHPQQRRRAAHGCGTVQRRQRIEFVDHIP